MYKSVPLYDVKLERWEKKDFPTQSSYVDWLWSLWKEPGQYDFDDTVHLFNEQAKIFNKRGVFCLHPTNSKDFVTYWEDQKDKCRNGVIYQNGNKEWFLPREYYMLLNFLKIYNKEKKNFTFIDVRDAQYHMALYEELAEHSGKHVAVLKKRQMLSSYYHAAKLINRFWFDSGAICKLAASLGTYVKDTWRFIDEYRNFLNQHTAWYRPCNPDKALDWQQKIEITQNGKKIDVGLKSVMKGLILDKDPSGGVGGPCLSPHTLIKCSNNTVKCIKDIKINDYVLGIDGNPKKVTKLYQGSSIMYDIIQSNGTTYTATPNHILYLYDSIYDDYIKISVSNFLRLPSNQKINLKGIKYDEINNKISNDYSDITIIPNKFGDYNGFECEDGLFILANDNTITHNCTIFFYDEAGIAPKLNQTLEFLLPALKSGMSYTGMYIAAGSVGDLADCEPLEELIRRPNSKDVLAVKTNLLDDKGTIGECGLFIPEQWSMLPYVDEYGNSKVEEAVEAILEERERWKKELTPADYQLRISQKPLNIDEAFAAREESPFPLHLISQQIERIKNNTYYLEHVELDRDIEGKIIIKPSRKLPISEFPVRMNAENKEGVIVMHERPVEGAKFGTYYASLDPVSSGKTSSSNSLASIYIYKNATEVTIVKEDGRTEHRLEKGKLVCWWTGRFDDLKMTHQRIEMMLELYNAWCVIENNVSQFIQYMQERNKQRYLVPKDQLVFLKDIKANTNVYQDYGWRNVGRLFKDTLLPYGIGFLSEPLDIETKPDGEITKTYYGIERIPDIMLLKEMQAYKDSSGNYDRLIAYCALTAFVAVQIANKGNNKERRYETKNLDKSKNNSNLVISPFKSIGNKGSNLSQKGIQRSAFKKLR